ncbi:MAG: response regulator [Algisphaera sp.]
MSEILIVDDLAVFRDPVADALRRHGHMVTTAENGRQCLDMVIQKVPDLILLDISMPVLGGIDTLLALRADPRSSHMPVIMLTDTSDRESITHAAQLGINGYVLKSSFSFETLLARIGEALDSRTVDAELDELGVIEAPTKRGAA